MIFYFVQKIDIYACGIMMYFLLTAKHPLYVNGDSMDLFKRKLTTREPQTWDFPHYISK